MESADLRALFGLAAALVAWAYVGYPLYLIVRARTSPAPGVEKAPITPRVTLVLVVRDEAARIEEKIRNCLALDYPPDRLQVVVVSDGSTDGTDALVRRFSSDRVRLVRAPEPRGKAAALDAIVPTLEGDVVLLCDARQHLEPLALRELVANLADPTVGAASGELHIRAGSSAPAEGVGLYWRIEKRIRQLESRLGSTVGVTGAIYVVRRALFPRLDPRTILDDVAVPLHVVRSGYRVVFEPAARAWDEPVEDQRREFRRKVRTLAGNYQLVAMDPSLLVPWRNPAFFGFLSHKLARLLVPWALLLMLAVSLLLTLSGSIPFGVLLGLQLAFYGAALYGWARGPRHCPRLLAVPHAFFLLNVAAAAALATFLLGRQRAAWKAPPEADPRPVKSRGMQ